MKKVLLFFLVITCIFTFLYCFYKPQKENKVVFSSWGSQSEVKILKEILTDFENETKINVEFIHIPQNYFQKIHLLFASNLEPDVVFINNHYLKMYSDANLLEDLTPYFSAHDFQETALNCLKDNGKLYAVPRDISALVIYVNKNIVKEKEIKLSSLDDLKSLAKKYTNDEHFGINYEEDPLFWLYFLAANGGGAVSDDLNSIIIDKKESTDALNLYANLANKYHVAPTKAQIGSMTTAQMFINGKLALYLGGRWMMPKFKEAITFDWDIIEFPATNKNKVYVDASGWSVSKKSKNKENAIKLVQYLSSEKCTLKLEETGLITPARITEQENDIFRIMLKNTKPTPTNKSYGKINDILKERGQSVLSGEKRAEDAFDKKTIKELESLL